MLYLTLVLWVIAVSFLVFILERLGTLYEMVRLYELVSVGTTHWDHHLSGNASDGRVDQESCTGQLVH